MKTGGKHSEETRIKIRIARSKQVMKRRPILRNGYLYEKRFDHPFCGKQGYVAQHRLIMEIYIGRFLNPKETIHHINGIKTDNKLDNLQLFATRGEHTKFAHPEIAKKSSISNKGKRRSVPTEFKKGLIPWNKKIL